jgi:hypothetical protein
MVVHRVDRKKRGKHLPTVYIRSFVPLMYGRHPSIQARTPSPTMLKLYTVTIRQSPLEAPRSRRVATESQRPSFLPVVATLQSQCPWWNSNDVYCVNSFSTVVRTESPSAQDPRHRESTSERMPRHRNPGPNCTSLQESLTPSTIMNERVNKNLLSRH